MSYLTDVDITKALGKDIVIEPCFPNSLTPIGYDFTVGDLVFSLDRGLLTLTNGSYIVPSQDTVQILTKENLWVSSKIAGTFHSRVSLVSKGISHISTTLDPGWYGPLLITITNNSKNDFFLKPGKRFVTLIFSRVKTPTKTPHFKPAFRADILTEQMKGETKEYIKKVSSFLNPEMLAEFQKKVEEASNMSMHSKLLAAGKALEWRKWGNIGLTFLLYSVLFGLITLQMYWNKINYLINNIDYDSNVFASQLVAIIAWAAFIKSLKRK